MSRRLAIGDVFEVQVNPQHVRHFQYIADDATQLNSQVIRVFRATVGLNESREVNSLAGGDVDFHAHVFLRIGLKQGFWRKVGHCEPPHVDDVLFRDSDDYGNPEVKVSKRWYVWRINRSFEKVGELSPRYQRADIGVVVPPDSLVYRMSTGKYDFVFPDY